MVINFCFSLGTTQLFLVQQKGSDLPGPCLFDEMFHIGPIFSLSNHLEVIYIYGQE